MLWRLASAWGDSPPRNSCTTWRLNSIECVRCLAMGFLLESPVQLADSQGPYLSTPKGALHRGRRARGTFHAIGARLLREYGLRTLRTIASHARNCEGVLAHHDLGQSVIDQLRGFRCGGGIATPMTPPAEASAI